MPSLFFLNYEDPRTPSSADTGKGRTPLGNMILVLFSFLGVCKFVEDLCYSCSGVPLKVADTREIPALEELLC